MENIPIYCLSYQGQKKIIMKERFEKVGLNVEFSDGVSFDDPRLSIGNEFKNSMKCFSCTFGHLDMIQKFVDSQKPLGIFCEDDIRIHKGIGKFIASLPQVCAQSGIDIILLGYLANWSESPEFFSFRDSHLKEGKFQLQMGADRFWGAQMYALTQRKAQEYIAKYKFETGYFHASLIGKTENPFSADFLFTKGGSTHIFPMLAVEHNYENQIDKDQIKLHKGTFDSNFTADFYV